MVTNPFARNRGRAALSSKGVSYLAWRYLKNGGRVRGVQNHEYAYPDAIKISERIRDQGIVVGPSSTYLSDAGSMILEAASEWVLNMADSEAASTPSVVGRKDYLIQLVPGVTVHDANSLLLKLALDQKLLEIVANYLGMLPSLYSVAAWLNIPSGTAPKESQLWHRDPEDLKIIKAFIYLVDVDSDRGPFCYIPGTQPFGKLAGVVPAHTDGIRISDDEMAAAIPRQDWKVCTGTAGTMIMADTIGFHRGGHAHNGRRILITFTYTSGTPNKPTKAKVAGAPGWLQSDLQRAALPPLA